MGICESKNNGAREGIKQIQIDKKDRNNSANQNQNGNEAIIPGNPPPVDTENLKFIKSKKP